MSKITLWTTCPVGNLPKPGEDVNKWTLWSDADRDVAEENARAGGFRLVRVTAEVEAVEVMP